ncbi:MAG TPA: hypothetical protein VGM90_06585 [Kofleriaceae bacterium]|jgi:hypothetical protein
MMKKTLVLATFLGLFSSACGDDGGNDHTDAGPIDGHSGSDAPTDGGEPAHERAFVVAGDFGSTGTLAQIDIQAKTVQKNLAPTGAVLGDVVMRHFGNELFVVNRSDGNSLTILKDTDHSLVEMVGTGANSNPQDVAIVGNKVYVATYEGKGVKTFTRGTSSVTEIDLSADDTDGNPNCSSVYAVGTKVFVACQLKVDGMLSMDRGPGKVYVIDSATNTKVATLTLSTHNPFSLFEQLPTTSDHAGDLIIDSTDFVSAGCIERITTGATPTAPGCLVQNSALGGYVSRFDFSQARAYMVVTGASGTGDVKTMTLSSSTVNAGKINGASEPIGDVAVCSSGSVVMTEQPGFGAPTDAPNGVRIYSGTDQEQTTTPLDIGRVPSSAWSLTCD